jgi:hypothetical protein
MFTLLGMHIDTHSRFSCRDNFPNKIPEEGTLLAFKRPENQVVIGSA